jgi:hypothetical protein
MEKLDLESSFYHWTQRPWLALAAWLFLHPLTGGGTADISWAVIITSNTTIPASPRAARIAKIASCVCLFNVSVSL